jgi:hypothetical protein
MLVTLVMPSQESLLPSHYFLVPYSMNHPGFPSKIYPCKHIANEIIFSLFPEYQEKKKKKTGFNSHGRMKQKQKQRQNQN